MRTETKVHRKKKGKWVNEECEMEEYNVLHESGKF